jgi:hypothetical protein
MIQTGSLRLGELLTKAGIINNSDLNEAMQVAAETGLPIGRVLVMSGFLAERELTAAIQAQSMIKDGVVSAEVAIKALAETAEEGVSLEKALKKQGWVRLDSSSTNKLGGLLLDSGAVLPVQLDEALSTCRQTGLPLGRVLVITGVISEQLLTSVLNAQVLIRDGKITREHAIEGLRSAKKLKITVEQSLSDSGVYRMPSRQTIRLGEMFVLAGLLSESDLMNLLELGLVNEKPIGNVIVDSGLITRELVSAALRLQTMVQQGTLTALQAAEALAQVHAKGLSISAAIAELGLLKGHPHETIRLGELLTVAGFITPSDIDKAVELSTKNSALIGKMLLVSGAIDESTLHASLRCQFLIREGFLKMEQAIIALNYCQRKQVSFDEAMDELGWKLNPDNKASVEVSC